MSLARLFRHHKRVADLEKETLADLLRSRMQVLGIKSGSELAERTEGAPSGRVSRAVVYRYLTPGWHQRPEDRVLQSLAWALGITVDRLRRAAELPSRTPWTPPAEAELLSPRERAAVEEIIRCMAASRMDPAGDDDAEGSLRLESVTVEQVLMGDPPRVVEADRERERDQERDGVSDPDRNST